MLQWSETRAEESVVRPRVLRDSPATSKRAPFVNIAIGLDEAVAVEREGEEVMSGVVEVGVIRAEDTSRRFRPDAHLSALWLTHTKLGAERWRAVSHDGHRERAECSHEGLWGSGKVLDDV